MSDELLIETLRVMVGQQLKERKKTPQIPAEKVEDVKGGQAYYVKVIHMGKHKGIDFLGPERGFEGDIVDTDSVQGMIGFKNELDAREMAERLKKTMYPSKNYPKSRVDSVVKLNSDFVHTYEEELDVDD
jgi:hypothetical protein